MDRRRQRPEDRWLRGLAIVAVTGYVTLVVVLAVADARLVVLLAGTTAATLLALRRLESTGGLQVDQMQRLRQAEVALAAAGSTEAAARELAEHAMALLGAPHAAVIIEGIGDTVRVSLGDDTGSVFHDGSRMRLLDDDGVPCGSIAVSARADGRPYTKQQEHMLDALAQRVSSTLHRLSLFTGIQAERGTLSDVLTSSSDGIFTVGLDMAVRSWNPAMARITGVPSRRAVGLPVTAVFRPVGEDGRPRFGQADPGRSGRPEVELVALEGTAGEQWLTCSWSPLSEGGYVVVARDDTERKRLQDDKDGWIAQVSHELRTPLTPIKGFLHTLQRRDEQFSPEERARIYEVMLREEQRLEDLVDSLLKATSIDEHGLVVVLDGIDWPTLLREQAELYQRTELTRTIEVRVADDVEGVAADRNLATGVLANLLSNALKYSPEGSSVEVDCWVEDDLVVTTVSDQGPGVAPADRDRIFEKFTRLGDHLTRPQQGVGLGLFIARRSLERMGGEIWCDEGAGGGARFGFTLPAHPLPAALAGTGAAPRRHRGRARSPRPR